MVHYSGMSYKTSVDRLKREQSLLSPPRALAKLSTLLKEIIGNSDYCFFVDECQENFVVIVLDASHLGSTELYKSSHSSNCSAPGQPICA